MEQKSKEMLIIDPPNELRFCGPFTRPVVTIMKLTNPTENTMLFKIKTTAPKRYCVRPNFGSVNPQSFTKVEICLQPFVYDANEKNKHKFMVQSLVAPDGDNVDYSKLWKDAEPHQLMDAKLKCVFEMPAITSVGDSSGSAPAEMIKEVYSQKIPGEEKISNLQTSDQAETMMIEVKQLREENTGLRKENINLKEQIVRLRVSPTKPPMDEPYTPMLAEKQIPMFYIAIAVAAAVFGVLLGKYLL